MEWKSIVHSMTASSLQRDLMNTSAMLGDWFNEKFTLDDMEARYIDRRRDGSCQPVACGPIDEPMAAQSYFPPTFMWARAN